MSQELPISTHWHVVHAKPRQEVLAQENLERQGYAVYLPRLKLIKRLRGKQQALFEPMFPRYLFVRPASQSQSIAPIRSTFGVSGLVSFGQQPAMIREEMLEQIRSMERANHAASEFELNPFLPGQDVRIVDGPLAELEGVVYADRQERVLVLLHLLGRETRVSLDRHQLMLAH